MKAFCYTESVRFSCFVRAARLLLPVRQLVSAVRYWAAQAGEKTKRKPVVALVRSQHHWSSYSEWKPGNEGYRRLLKPQCVLCSIEQTSWNREEQCPWFSPPFPLEQDS